MKKVSTLQKNLANNIRVRRKRLALTQTELAKAVDVTPSFITEIETGKKAPSFATIEKIAEVLQTPAWTLFTEYTGPLKTESDNQELVRFILKNKISDIIDEILK